MKTIINYKWKILTYSILTITMVVYSCSDGFLDQPQKGALGDSQVLSQKGVNQALIGAYSALKGNAGNWDGEFTNWVFGSIVGGDAHKGSDGGDQADINSLADYTVTSTNAFVNAKWVAIYAGVARANTVLKLVKQVSDEQVSAAEKKKITAEAKFLRGFYHFEAQRMWFQAPYVDETKGYVEGDYAIPNDHVIWDEIIADFKAAYDDLAGSGMDAGRANKWAAAAYLGKVYLYKGDYTNAKKYFDDVITNGTTPGGVKYGLNTRFHDNYEVAFDNGKESIFSYQASINDGSGGNNANYAGILNWPYNNGPGNCCGFFQPTIVLVNSYRTDINGLPLLDGSYNTTKPVKNDMNITNDKPFTPDADNLDPRLDWTAGRRGIPYIDWGNHPGSSWVRLQSNGGPNSPKKNAYAKEDAGNVTDASSWTPGLTAVNFVFMRYADLLLMAAEAEVEASTGSVAQALVYVNLVRARAANPDGFVKISNVTTKSDWAAYKDPSIASTPAAKYVINQYPAGAFADKDYARKAIRMERKLELAMEGHRFFDLARWNMAASELTDYINVEGAAGLTILQGKQFSAKNVHYPIPQNQLDLQKGVISQDPKY